MSLSEQDKIRIREEETFRCQVRDELGRHRENRWKGIVVWIVLIVAGGLLIVVVKTGNN